MIAEHLYHPAVTGHAPRSRRLLMGAAGALVVLNVIDAFLIEVPVTSILFAVIFAASAVRLRRPDTLPVWAIGSASAVQLLLVLAFLLFFTGATSSEVVVASVIGVNAVVAVTLALYELWAKGPP